MNLRPTKLCSRRGAFWLVLALTQCAPARSGVGFETTTERADAASHPPGIAVDPVSVLPLTQREGESAQGIVVLQAERGPADAERIVRRFLEAVAREDAVEVRDVVDSSAVFRRSFSARGEDALSIWLGRLSQLDYDAAHVKRVLRRQLAVYSGSDLRRRRGQHPLGVDDGDFAVLFKPGASKELFGSELWFVVGQRGDALRITQFIEDFPPP